MTQAPHPEQPSHEGDAPAWQAPPHHRSDFRHLHLPAPTRQADARAVQRPWVSINLAISADGKIAAGPGAASGWTSREDHQRLLDLRKNRDALLVGRATLEADHMTLTVPDQTRQPLRCIASRSGQISPEHPLFHRPGGPIHLLAAHDAGELSPPSGTTLHRGTLADFLNSLAVEDSIRTLHCEGGGGLIRSLAELQAIDEIHLTLAGHTLFGSAAAPTLTGIPADFLSASSGFDLTHFDPRPDLAECFLTYHRHGAPPRPAQWPD